MASSLERLRSRAVLVGVATLFLCIALPLRGSGDAPPGSSIHFVGENLFSTANGTFHSWRLVEAVVWTGGLENGEVKLEVDLASVDTDNERRDDHLRTADFFDVEQYPIAKVRVHSAVGSGVDGQGRAAYNAKFDLDLHGVSKTLEGEFVVISTSPFVAEGEVVVDRLDFGIGEPQSVWNPMSIGEEIPVTFRLTVP